MSYEITHAMWLPLTRDFNDSLGNTSPDAVGTTTNAWDTPGYLTLTAGAGLCIEATGSYIEEMWDLSTLTNGSLCWSIELYHEAIPTSTRDYVFSINDFTTDTTNGAVAVGFATSDNLLLQYAGKGGSASQSVPHDLVEPLTSTERSVWVQIGMIINRIPRRNAGQLTINGTLRGRTGDVARGFYASMIEGVEWTVDSTVGLRLLGRGTGDGTAADTYGDEAGMNARARNFAAFRVSGDSLHRIPKWFRDMQTLRDMPKVIKEYLYGAS